MLKEVNWWGVDRGEEFMVHPEGDKEHGSVMDWHVVNLKEVQSLAGAGPTAPQGTRTHCR